MIKPQEYQKHIIKSVSTYAKTYEVNFQVALKALGYEYCNGCYHPIEEFK